MTKKHRSWRVKARADGKLPAYCSKKSRAYLIDLTKRTRKKQLSIIDVAIDTGFGRELFKMYGGQSPDIFTILGIPSHLLGQSVGASARSGLQIKNTFRF